MFPTRAACRARPTVKLSQTLKRHLAFAMYYSLRIVQAPPRDQDPYKNLGVLETAGGFVRLG
jgi:hypothetical protein